MRGEVLARFEVERNNLLSAKYLAAHRTYLGDPEEQADGHICLVLSLLPLLLRLFFLLFSLFLALYRVFDFLLDSAVFFLLLRAGEILAVNTNQFVYEVAGDRNHFIDFGLGLL